MHANRTLLSIGLLLAAVPAALAQKNTPANIDPDPEVERKSFQVADGFEVNLYAADPLLAKPVAMNFDPAGRLWIACSEAYPQIKPGVKQNDKIIVLEDTKGAGVADKTTVFADGLLIPTASCRATAAPTSWTVRTCFISRTPTATARRTNARSFCRDSAPKTRTTWSTPCAGAGRAALLQPVGLHPQPHRDAARRSDAERQRHLAVPAGDARAERLLSRPVEPVGHRLDRFGATFETDGAGGEGINYTSPAPPSPPPSARRASSRDSTPAAPRTAAWKS